MVDIEEAILQLARFGVKRDEVEQRVKQELLIVYPYPKNLQVRFDKVDFHFVVARVFLVTSAAVLTVIRNLLRFTSKKNAR